MQYKAASSRENLSARMIGVCAMLTHDLFDASHGSAFQTDFDPMRMRRGFCEDIFDHTFCQFTCALILFQDDEHSQSGFNRRASLSVHDLQYSICNKRGSWALPLA